MGCVSSADKPVRRQASTHSRQLVYTLETTTPPQRHNYVQTTTTSMANGVDKAASPSTTVDADALNIKAFDVSIFNNKGVKCPGALIVTPDSMTLRRHNMRDIVWPLIFIRRYGHDHNVFTIESGRRAATGAGIFTFASEQARELFQLVQSHVDHPSSNTLPAVNRRHNRSSTATTSSRTGSGSFEQTTVANPLHRHSMSVERDAEMAANYCMPVSHSAGYIASRHKRSLTHSSMGSSSGVGSLRGIVENSVQSQFTNSARNRSESPTLQIDDPLIASTSSHSVFEKISEQLQKRSSSTSTNEIHSYVNVGLQLPHSRRGSHDYINRKCTSDSIRHRRQLDAADLRTPKYYTLHPRLHTEAHYVNVVRNKCKDDREIDYTTVTLDPPSSAPPIFDNVNRSSTSTRTINAPSTYAIIDVNKSQALHDAVNRRHKVKAVNSSTRHASLQP